MVVSDRACLFFILSLCIFKNAAYAQRDTTDQLPGILEDQIESFLGNLDDEIDFDFNTVGEYLKELAEHPININTVSIAELENLRLLSDIQIGDFFEYRARLGKFLSIYELQAIPSFNRKIINTIRPFITLQNALNLPDRRKLKMLWQGKNELYTRWSRFIEPQKGYQAQQDRPPAFEGSPNQFYIRYRHRFENELSYGFTLEKDAGESIFAGSNPQGFDFASFHFYLRNYSPVLKALAIGDYAISLGQGLLLHSGFGRGKSSFVTQIKKGGRIIRPYTSVSEASFLRGAATILAFGSWQLTVFGSKANQDANIRVDSLDNDGEYYQFSNLQLSGYHRTQSEIEDENAINQRVIGTQIAYQSNHHLHIALNYVNNHFDRPFVRTPRLYNQFYFLGTDLSNASLEYTYLLKNFHFFGETAMSGNGAIATITGVLIGLGKYLDLAILYRNLSEKYQALQANPFLESSQALNERGLYIGTEIKFNHALSLSLYADYWRHPWLRFNIDAPSTGREYLARFTYYQKRKLDAYIQYRYEQKATNNRDFSPNIAQLFYGQPESLRIHFNNKLNSNLELRNRMEFSWVIGPKLTSKGFLIYQDVIFRSLTSPLSFTARIAYFDADNFAARVYAYENDLLYSFSIPAFFNEGIRYYGNLRYRMNKSVTLEARWEQTRFVDIDRISNGNTEILGNTRSRIKMQLKVSF